MITYILIGIIVQVVILIERAIRVPDYIALMEWSNWLTWVVLLAGLSFNVLVWPITIICEIMNIIHGI